MDFARLRAEGIQHLQGLSGEIWTDHNAHDPGITILEALCYAITDVGYRTQMALDALADPALGNGVLPLSTVPRREDVLPCHPLTPRDFREVLLDWREPAEDGGNADRLRDAWVEPWSRTPKNERPCGIYRVALEFDDPDLNHFISVNRVDDHGGVIGGWLNGKEIAAEKTMTIEEPPSVEKFPFLVRSSEEDIEISFPRWDSLGPEWFEAAKLTAVSPGAVTALKPLESKTYECKVAAKLGAKDVSFTVSVRVISELDSATDVPRAIQRAIMSAAQVPKEVGQKNLFARFKEAMEKVGALRRKIADHLERRRNLCEFFPLFAIIPMPVDELGVSALVRIDSNADENKVAQEFHRRIARVFSPQVLLQSPAQKVREGLSVPEAWEGPRLTNFDAARASADRTASTPTEDDLCASDVIRLLMEIPGVRAVDLTRLSLFTSGAEAEEPIFAIADLVHRQPGHDVPRKLDLGRRLRLSVLDSRTALTFQRVDEHGTLGEIIGPVALRVEEEPPLDGPAESTPSANSSVPFAWEVLREYHSIEQELPSVYGLKATSIPRDSANPRATQALQLRGYLAFFDQILANASAQLEKTPQLLTCGPADIWRTRRKTWFTQPLGKALGPAEPDLESLLMDGMSLENLSRTGTKDQEALRGRAGRLIDHLLARHGVASTLDESAKQKLLEALPRDAMVRSAPTDPSDPKAGGMQRRLANLAGAEFEDLWVIEPLALVIEGDKPPGDQEITDSEFSLIVVANQERFVGQKAQFEVLVQREAPAHLAVKVLWCDRARFDAIQKDFIEWHQAVRQANRRGELANSLRAKLAAAQTE
ncbi:MAG TPA: hypothetical protein DCE44_09860 [Verrucomicrobiales bacterium]|nr:hypothetical protein [Verrucomicrobiales bacterium]